MVDTTETPLESPVKVVFVDSFVVVLVAGFIVPNPSLLKLTVNPSGIAPLTRFPSLSCNKSAVIVELSPIFRVVGFAVTVNTIQLTTSKFVIPVSSGLVPLKFVPHQLSSAFMLPLLL